MQPLEPRLLMAADVVYALNAGGPDFIDANGIAWINDTAFTNNTEAFSFTASTTSAIDRNDPSVPANTDERLFQTERYDAGQGEEMAYALGVANGIYEVDLYFADTFSGTQGVGDRVFDIVLEGQTVADNYDVVADAGRGFKGVVQTFTVAVDDGVLDLEFLHEVENPAIKAILVRTVDVDPPDPVAPVIDLNGPAAGTGTSATHVIAAGPTAITTPQALLTDTDSATLDALTVTITNQNSTGEQLDADVAGTAISKQYFNGNGILRLTGTASVADYQAVLRTVTYENLFPTPDLSTRSIRFVANDGGLDSAAATATVALERPVVDPVAPVVDLNGPAAGTDSNANFVAGDAPVLIAGLDASITDADSATLRRLTVTLTNLQDAGEEILTADTANSPINRSYSANGVLTLSGFASVTEYQNVLRTVTYNNTAATPDTTTRSIEVVADDGDLLSSPAVATVTIEAAPPVPVPPVLDLNGSDTGVNVAATFVVGDGPASIIPPEALLTDADSATLNSITAKISPIPADSFQSLAVDTDGTPIVASFNNGTLRLTGTATVAQYQAVLRTVTYDNTDADPDPTPRVITFVANDGQQSSLGASVIVQIQKPVVQPGTVVYALNAGGNGFTDANGIEWIADTPFTNEADAVSFGFSSGANIDRSHPSLPADSPLLLLQSERWDSGSGEEMTYTLDVADGNYQVDLYFADIFSGTQSIGARVFDVQLEGATVLDDYDIFADVGGFAGVVQSFDVNITDGAIDIEFLHETENPAIKGVLVRTLDAVAPDPIAPVVDLDENAGGSNSSATFEAGTGPVNVAADATLADADSATLDSLSVFLVNTPDGAAERLDADLAGTSLTKSFAGGLLSLTGVATVAEYQAVLRTVTYDNLAANPDLAARSINAVANDGTLDSNTAIATVTVENNTVLPQPGRLVADVQTLDFNNAQVGVVERFTITLTHPGAAIDDPVVITGTDFNGLNQADFGDLFTEQYGDSATVNPGESIELTFYALPQTTGAKSAGVFIVQDGSTPLNLDLEANAVDQISPGFGTGFIAGLDATTPTTLQWGPDNRLYVGTLDGLILAYTIERNGPNDYDVTDTQTITLVQDIPNHEDDGTLNPDITTRLITGLKVVGTASDPILYVTSSDPRLANGDNSTIDTNSGIVSKLTQNGDGSWDKVDLVRGLPRSAVDHAPHALQLIEDSNTLLVAVGGLTNAGGPGEFFGNLPEYALSAAVLSLDLDTLEALPTQTDANGQQFKYNLPTLNDEDRAGDGDAGDPFGGNAGKNQAVLEENGPVGIFASGLRNPYDFVITQFGDIYATDNGPNSSIGDVPILDANGQPTNQPSPGGSSAKDALHRIAPGSYSGHPNPTRANTDNTFNNTNPQSPVFPSYTEPGTYTANGDDDALALFDTSTNGITEYTATGFGGALNGDLLTVTIDGKLTRLKLSPDGSTVIDREILFNDAGAYPLDLTAVGDDHPFAGTIWVADLFAGPGEAIRVYEPNTGSGQGTPEDLDGDGYLNQDEIDNGTNPESAGDTPTDNDKDFLSDLNDVDDDNDLAPDLTDPFQVDATNGNNTNAPFTLSFDNDDLNRGGLLDLGFTGVMTNGSTNYRDQFDFANLTAGSAAGVLTIDAVGSGTALGPANNQENAFQFGLNLNDNSQPVTIQTKIDSVFDNTTPAAGQRAGIYFGTGDQDNYIAVFVEGDGTINTVTEIDGQPTFGTGDIIGPDNFTNLNLYLTVDPATQTVQAAYSFGTGPITELLGTTDFPAAWLQADTAPAVGVIATSGDSGEAYSVTYDFIRVEPAGGNDGQAPFDGTPNRVGERVEAEAFDLGGDGVAYLDLSAFNEGNANPRPGELVDFEPTSDAGGGINVGWIEAGEYLEYTFDIETAGTYSADFRVALDSGTGSTFHLEINGQNISGPINLPVTGGWQSWQTVTATDLQLEAGPVVLRVAFDTASTGRFVGNFNWLQLNAEDPNQNNGLDLGDSNEFNWVDAPPIPGGDRFEGMSITADNIVYAFGGFSDGVQDKLVDVWAYDIANNQWSARTSMPSVINHLNAVYDQQTGIAWFVGGYKGDFPGEATEEVWLYDVANDSWSAGPALPAPRSSGNLAQVGRTLHFIGGFPDRTSDASLDHYTLDLDNPSAGWTLLGVQSPASRGHASTAVLGTDIYILGGQIAHDTNTTDQDEVFVFDTLTQTWSQAADLPFGWSHAEPSTFTANGRIFMAGGRSNVTGRGQIDDFYMYDPDIDAWVQLPDLPQTLLGPVFTVVDDPEGPSGGHGSGCCCDSCQALFGTTGAFNGLNGTSESFAADFDDVWSSLPDLPAQIGEIAAGVIDNVLYVVGDGNNGTYAYDFTTSQWRNENRDRPVPAKDQLAEVIDGKLYVMGGISYSGGRQTFNDLQIYDPATKTWTAGTDLPENIFAAQTTVIDGKIYLTGGVTNADVTTDHTYVYDPASGPGGSWTQLADAPLLRNSAAVGTDGSKMYIFGGRVGGDAPGNGFTSVMIYDPVADTWETSEDPGSTLAELPQARGGIVNAPFIDGEFYVIGGETDNDPAANAVGLFDRVDIYDPLTNTWRQGEPMLTARHGIYPVAHAGAVYIPGGGVVKGASNSNVFDVYYPNLI